MYIGLSGKMCSGKDTTADRIITAYGGVQAAFADNIKASAKMIVHFTTGETIDPWNDKTPRVRSLLQVLGTEVGRAFDSEIWVKALFRQTEGFLSAVRHVIVTDVRFPNEVTAIEEQGGVVIRLDCDETVRRERVLKLYGEESLSPERQGHASEVALDDYPFTYIIDTTDFASRERGLLDVVEVSESLGKVW